MDKVESIRKFLLNMHDNINFAVIFGSHVYETANESSDIDLIVVLSSQQSTTDTPLEALQGAQSFNENTIGNIDITYYSDDEFKQHIKDNEVKAVESLFIPSKFVVIGNSDNYKELLILNDNNLRRTFGKICRTAWDRGVKKLTKETSEKEIKIGKKSLYHSIRLFHFAIQLYKTGKIDFTCQELKEINKFYFDIKDKNVTDLIDNNKIKSYLHDIYVEWDKKFKVIPK